MLTSHFLRLFFNHFIIMGTPVLGPLKMFRPILSSETTWYFILDKNNIKNNVRVERLIKFIAL